MNLTIKVRRLTRYQEAAFSFDGTLMESGLLNEVESKELARELINAAHDLVRHNSEELGEKVYEALAAFDAK